MKPPLHQRASKIVMYILGGFLALGVLLDSVANAISLLTPLVAIIGTACIVLVWCLAYIILPLRPLPWVFVNQRLLIKKPGIQPTAFAVGMILLLWVPWGLTLFHTPPPEVTTLLEHPGELQRVSEELTRLLAEIQRTLGADKGQSDLPSDFKRAIEELSHGRTGSAESLLRRMVEEKARGEAPHSRAAEVLSHLTYRTWGLNFTVDSDGNVVIADHVSDRILRSGQHAKNLSVLAGSGVRSFGGDGGQAVDAALAAPSGPAFGPDGKLYFSTLAGTGAAGYAGDGGLGSHAMLDGPYGIAVDAFDNVYIADYRNCRIRKVDALTGIISTLAGNGDCINAGDGGPLRAARFMNPHTLVFSHAGDLYVGVKSSSGQAIRVIHGASRE